MQVIFDRCLSLFLAYAAAIVAGGNSKLPSSRYAGNVLGNFDFFPQNEVKK